MRYFILAVSFLVACSCYSQGRDTFEVYFSTNNTRLAKESQDYIDRLIFNDTLIHGDKLIILGYADFVGGRGHNDTLSKQRARSVKDYLVKMGFENKDISLCVGKGKIERSNGDSGGYLWDRKVQIVIDHRKNDLPMPPPPKAAEVPKTQPRINIADLKVNEAFALNNIFFKPESDELLPESQSDLERLLTFMQDNKSVRIQIEGHVCCLGEKEGVDEPYLKGYLSRYRAGAIYKYLIDKGVDKQRMKAIGLGNLNPAAKPEITEVDRRRNRRVEIRILSK